MKKILLGTIPILMLLLASCSSSKITHSYVAKNDVVPSKKILVVGLFDEKNKAAKQEMEQQLADDLKKFGYDAITATDQYGLTSFSGLKESDAIDRVRNDGFESVITISLLDKNKTKNYVPGSTYYGPRAGFYRPWGYSYSPFAYPYNPYRNRGYVQTRTSYFFETNLYDVNNSQVIYSAQSQSFDASTLGNLANDYGRNIVRDMRKKNVLG